MSWIVASNRGMSSASFTPSGRRGPGIVGELRLYAESVERPNERLWEANIGPTIVMLAAFRDLLDGLETWLSHSEPFVVLLVDDEVRLSVEFRVEDGSLVLGPGKAGLHFIWSGVGMCGCDVAFVVDETCVREAACSLRAMLATVTASDV